MKIKMYQVDAFSDRLFAGNPAAVCLLQSELDMAKMQAIAAENNLAETAFVLPQEKGFLIRWFTPINEVALCGHATLAAAFILFREQGQSSGHIDFKSLHSGNLGVGLKDGFLSLNFPADYPKPCDTPAGILESMGQDPQEIYQGQTDYLLVYKSQEQLETLQPDFRKLRAVEARGVIATAPGLRHDFVSRFFAPRVGIDEDPVTGSAHTTLTPYWSEKLAKNDLRARQISARGRELRCQMQGKRVIICGQAVLYLAGTIEV